MTIGQQTNVYGEPLEPCNFDPMTGFYRTGCCETGGDDAGVHTVCAVMTAEFLEYSKSVGNDLSTPMPQYGFAGLKPGDQWCLCAPRWQEAFEAGKAPKVKLRSTHTLTLEFVALKNLDPRYRTPRSNRESPVLAQSSRHDAKRWRLLHELHHRQTRLAATRLSRVNLRRASVHSPDLGLDTRVFDLWVAEPRLLPVYRCATVTAHVQAKNKFADDLSDLAV